MHSTKEQQQQQRHTPHVVKTSSSSSNKISSIPIFLLVLILCIPSQVSSFAISRINNQPLSLQHMITNIQSSDDMDLSTTYTDDEIRSALLSLSSHDVSKETHGHLRGYDDDGEMWKNDDDELTMLQRITGTRILDYERFMSSPKAPSRTELQNQIQTFQTQNGPIQSLSQTIQSKSPIMALAAEFKRASPSKGNINLDADIAKQSASYAGAGACIISVLTEPRWFRGSLEDMKQCRLSTLKERPVVLRKEFIINEYQILEAAANGADTILLIVSILPLDTLQSLIQFAREECNMEPLVEIHSDDELDVAVKAGAKVLGVNNRNLHTFFLDMKRTEDVISLMRSRGLKLYGDDDEKDDGYVLCSLSGMSNKEDVNRYRKIGVKMCLVGESLMRSPEPELAIKNLCLDPNDYIAPQQTTTSSTSYTGSTKLIKICGITNPQHALWACRAGANLIGVIFAEKSKRRVSVKNAKEVVDVVRKFGERTERIDVLGDFEEEEEEDVVQNLRKKAALLEKACERRPMVVGVFQNQSTEYINDMIETCGLDLVQLHGKEGMKACHPSNYHDHVPAFRVVDIETDENGNFVSEDGRDGAVTSILDSLTHDPLAILLDTSMRGSGGGGGTGVTFDWSIADKLQGQGLPVIVAGGLGPDNVREAVMDAKPWGLDVSSGVEEKAGVKDLEKVKAFLERGRKASIDSRA